MSTRAHKHSSLNLFNNSEGIEYIILGGLGIIGLFSLLKWGMPSVMGGFLPHALLYLGI